MARAVQILVVAVAIFASGHLAVARSWKKTTCKAGLAALLPQAGMTKLDCDTIRDDALTNLATCRLRDALGYLDTVKDLRAARAFSGCSSYQDTPTTLHLGCENFKDCLQTFLTAEGDYDCGVDNENTAKALTCLDKLIAEGCVAVGNKFRSIVYQASCRLCY